MRVKGWTVGNEPQVIVSFHWDSSGSVCNLKVSEPVPPRSYSACESSNRESLEYQDQSGTRLIKIGGIDGNGSSKCPVMDSASCLKSKNKCGGEVSKCHLWRRQLSGYAVVVGYLFNSIVLSVHSELNSSATKHSDTVLSKDFIQ